MGNIKETQYFQAVQDKKMSRRCAGAGVYCLDGKGL